MSNFPYWFHWLLCGLIVSAFWLSIMIVGFSYIGFPRKRERELERYVKELEGSDAFWDVEK